MVRLVTIAGAVGGFVAVWLPGGAVRPDRPDLDVVLGALGLAGVAASSFATGVRARLAAGVLAAAATAWALLQLTRDILSGLPGSSTAVLAASAVVVLAAVVAAAVRPLRLPLTAALVVVLVAAAVGAGLVAPRVPARASEAAAVRVAPLADRPGERRWTWRSAEAVADVVVAGAGVVVATTGGELTGLDGSTGAPRWRYSRPGAHVRALVATPDRAAVVAGYAPGGDRDTGAELLVVLDAVTGTVLRESTVDERVTDPVFLLPTDTVLPLREPTGQDDTTVRGTDLRTGEELWTWSAPEGCTSPFFLPRVGPDVVFATLRCAREVGVVALDDRTGERRWARTAPAPTSTESVDVHTDVHLDVHVETTPDGRVTAVAGLGERGDVLLRTADGTELTAVDPGRRADLDVGARPLLSDQPGGPRDPGPRIGPEVVDPATGERLEIAPADCADPRATTTTATTLLRICGPAGQEALTWQDLTGGPLSRTPLRWARLDVSTTMLGGRDHAVVLPAPGAIVVARAGDTVVTGYPAG